MVACRFIVIKKPFLSKSQNTFPGERGNLPKAGNHSPVKFLDLSSDFPGSHRGTTARLHRNHPGSFSTRCQLPQRIPAARHTGTHSSQLPPGPRPSRDPRPSATRTIPAHFHPAPAPHKATAARHTGTPSSRLPPGPRPSQDPQPSATGTVPAYFHPAPAPPKGTRRQAYRNSLTPAPAQPESLPRPTAQLHRNHPGSLSIQRQPEGPARIALCLFPKGEIRPAQPDQGGGRPAAPGNYVHQRLQSGNILPQIRGFCKGGEGISSIFSQPTVFLG